MEEKKYLKGKSYLGYFLSSFGNSFGQYLITMVAMLFMTDYIGMNAGIVGILIAISKVLDGVTDVICGTVIQNTKSKLGRARAWMLRMLLPMGLLQVLFFCIGETWSNFAVYAYFFITYLVFNSVLNTLYGIAYNTIPVYITRNKNEQAKLSTANILMPESTDRTSLAGNFTMAPGFTCDKASGSRQNFTSPVVYTFTDGTDTIAWTVTVTCDVTADGPLVGTETTLDAAIAARSDWTQEPAEAENGGALFTPAKSFSAYIGDRIANDAILEFDVQSVLDGNDWTGYALRMQNPYDMLGTMYHIVFKQDAIELQKWVNGNRTMLIGTIEGYDPVYGDVENKFYTSDIRHSIKTGAIDVPTGVRLFLYIDGNKVFDVIDADDPITNDGFFGMYPMTHDMTLLPFSNIDTSPKPDPDPDPEPKPILPILPSGGQSAWKNPYQDVTDSSSYYEAVRYVTEKGLMNGTSASTFSPDAAMTRAMMVTILWRMEKEPAALKSNFTDLTADWYRTAVDWAAETGVVNGVGNGKFAPNATLSLEQLITILYRYAENKGYNVSKSASLDSFTDGSAVSAYAKPAMQWAVGMNFLSGNTLTPGAPASRAQIAQVLMLFCKAYIK